MNEKIKNSIDKIEPESGAKERMYQNILEKAAKAEKPKITAAKAARIALPVAACLCLVVFGISKQYHQPDTVEQPEESVSLGGDTSGEFLGNPYIEAENASAFEALGITMDAPDGSEKVSYAVIGGEIAEVVFSLDGHSYRLRAAKSGDISGLNGEIISREPIENGGDAELITIKIDGFGESRLIEWTSDSIHFSLSNSDGAAGDEMRAVFEKIK